MGKVLLMLVFSLGWCAFASSGNDHSDHEEEFIHVLKGTTPFGETCYLGVVESDSNGSYSAVVETSFSHGSSGPGELTVSLDANGRLSARTNQEEIVVTLSSGSVEIQNAKKYVVRWKHGSHWDTGICDNLVEVDVDEWSGGANHEEGHDEDHGDGHSDDH